MLIGFRAPFVVFALALFASVSFANAAKRPPNVVVIFADDLGWSDTGIYARHELHETPAIEALASRGMRFVNAYSSGPVCAPSRSALLTGLSTARTGMLQNADHKFDIILHARLEQRASWRSRLLEPISATCIRPSLDTLPEVLRDQGYATGHFGKWHLGPDSFGPLRNGYDEEISDKKRLFDEEGNHVDDLRADAAIAFMRKNRNRPFFVSYCPFSVHSPFEAKPGLVEAARRRAAKVRSDASPTYAAMVRTLDLNVRKVTSAIESLGLTEETIVIFSSDNGGVVHRKVDGVPATTNAPFRSGKGTLYEGGIRVPLVISWPGVIEEGTTSDALSQTIDLFPTILDLVGAEPASNLPLDGTSLAPALAGEPTGRDALFWYYPYESRSVPDRTSAGAAMRFGDFKLIREFYANDDGTDSLRLYDLSDDPGETTDLAKELPFAANAMDRMLDAWLNETDAVLPEPNPDYVPDELLDLGL